MNTLLEILKQAGYKNENTNRERAVRNINLLLDSGILSLKFCHFDKYSDMEKNWGFGFKSKDGKERCTNYMVTLFGKKYYGAFVAKRTKERTIFGDTEIKIKDNSKVDIESLQIRIAQLIKIIKDGDNFLTPELSAAKGQCSCSKCYGKGVIPMFFHYANGICFDCGGSGINRATLKNIISNAFNSVK